VKITKGELKKLIVEETSTTLNEGFLDNLTGAFKYSEKYLTQALAEIKQDIKALKKYHSEVVYKLDPEPAEQIKQDIDRRLPRVEKILKQVSDLGTGAMSRSDRNDLLEQIAMLMSSIWFGIEKVDESSKEMAAQKKELYQSWIKTLDKRNAQLRQLDLDKKKGSTRPRSGGSVGAGFKDRDNDDYGYSGYGESINRKGNTNMKVTRGELKQIINEELEAQILRENIISDLVDLIKDSGEEAADWVKKNAKTVAKAAKSIGSDVGDVADELLHKVDKVAGTEMSKSTRFKKALGKQQDAWDTQNAEAEAATAARNTPEAIAARQADREYEKEMEDWRAAGARVKAQDREWEKERKRKLKGDPKVYTPGGVDDDPWNKTHRGSNRAGSGNMGYGESIDRDELKKAIKEELAKVLQGK
jgi:hypothetical protein